MNLKTIAAKNEKLVHAWNSKHPESGVKVSVRDDFGAEKQTTTRSAAWLMGGHSAMILLDGISGGYSLDRVTAL